MKQLVLLSVLALSAAPAQAQWSVSGNATIVSDYVFRGVTQTQGKPTVQAALDLSHASGGYLGAFGSTVSHAAFNNGSGTELDLYGGYRFALPGEGKNIELGLITYWFPGAHYQGDGRDIQYHTRDVKLGWNHGAFNTYFWLTVSRNWSGFAIDPISNKYHDTRGTSYVEVNWNPELQAGLALNLHLGRQILSGLEGFDYTDAKVGLTQTLGDWVVSAGATHNNGKAERNGLPYWRFFDTNGSWKNVTGMRLVLTVARNF